MKHECRDCRFWIREHKSFGSGLFIAVCKNPKSPLFEKTPLYDSKCKKWRKE